MPLAADDVRQGRVVAFFEHSAAFFNGRYLPPADFIKLGLGNAVPEKQDPRRRFPGLDAKILYQLESNFLQVDDLQAIS